MLIFIYFDYRINKKAPYRTLVFFRPKIALLRRFSPHPILDTNSTLRSNHRGNLGSPRAPLIMREYVTTGKVQKIFVMLL